MALVDPGAQAYPAVQFPLHPADARPAVAPYVPPGHGEQDAAPPKLYCPVGQVPLHAAVVRPDVKPYVPAGQSVHDPALLPTLY